MRLTRWMLRYAAVVPLALLLYCGATAQPVVRPTDADVVYGRVDGQDLKLDIYRPDGGVRMRPAVVLLHGGGWAMGSKGGLLQRYLAGGLRKAGFVVCSVDYRLAGAGRNHYPAALDDAQRAVRWLRANTAKYGVDPNRIAAMGDSAGGYLAAMLGTCPTRATVGDGLDRYPCTVKCVVDLYGPSDFTTPRQSGENGLRLAILANFIGKKPAEAPALYRDASPISHVSRRSAAFLVFHGTKDPLVPIAQSERLVAALRKAGVDARLVRLEGEGHGFRNPANRERMVRETVAFLRARL